MLKPTKHLMYRKCDCGTLIVIILLIFFSVFVKCAITVKMNEFCQSLFYVFRGAYGSEHLKLYPIFEIRIKIWSENRRPHLFNCIPTVTTVLHPASCL